MLSCLCSSQNSLISVVAKKQTITESNRNKPMIDKADPPDPVNENNPPRIERRNQSQGASGYQGTERRKQFRRASDYQAEHFQNIFSSFETFGRHVLLLDSQAYVLYRSRRVDALLDSDTIPLRLEPRFTLHDSHNAKQFKAFINSLTQSVPSTVDLAPSALNHRRNRNCILLLERVDSSPLLLSCFPMQQSPGNGDELKIMAILCDPGCYSEEQWGAFQELFSLTAAELRLCLALADGLSLAEYGHKYDVTDNTARSQLKKVFEKTNTRRQGDLMRLIFLLTRL
jgi:DNA-binding CsgD family transcriptional regulator